MSENLPEPGAMKWPDVMNGVQPLDKIMTDLGLTGGSLVDISNEKLSFHNVLKGRKGRRIKLRVQNKILNALNACSPGKKFAHADLFTYQGP